MSTTMNEMNDFPRRNSLDKCTPAELAIYKAMDEVEKVGADVRLKNAIMKLNEDRNLVADFVDKIIEMPKYKCYKEVWALKIKYIVRDGEGENRESDGSAMITPEEEGYAPFRVEPDYLRKHKPQVGGYYVVYKDGYKSFSPAEAFEEGYSRI